MKILFFTMIFIFSSLLMAAPKGNVEFNDKASSHVSVHVLDTANGRSAPDVPVDFYKKTINKEWEKIISTKTRSNGHVYLLDSKNDNTGTYRLYVDISKLDENSFIPFINVTFNITDPSHYHIPLRLSGNSYTTYRGN